MLGVVVHPSWIEIDCDGQLLLDLRLPRHIQRIDHVQLSFIGLMDVIWLGLVARIALELDLYSHPQPFPQICLNTRGRGARTIVVLLSMQIKLRLDAHLPVAHGR